MLFHKNDTGNMLTVYYVRAYLMLCDDKFFSPQNWKTDSSWTRTTTTGGNNSRDDLAARTETRHDFLVHGDLLRASLYGRQG